MPPTIRRAEAADAARLGALGAALMRVHYAFDPQRFLAAGDHAEVGYASFLRSQLERDDTLVLVAEEDGRVIGYLFAALEPMSWKELRGPAGFVHDVLIEDGARHSGAGTALVEAALRWMRDRGAARAILGTAARNTAAQRLFERLGFRPTMIEMTREL